MLIAFFPVLHKGYLELFKKYPDELGILGLDVIADYTALTRDLRIIDPAELKYAIEGLRIFPRVRVLSKDDLVALGSSNVNIVMPDEDVSRDLAAKYFGDRIKFESVAIRNRWDKQFVDKENVVAPHRVVSTTEADLEFMQQATDEATKSEDWWRQVGTIIVKAGQIIASGHNKHLPSDYTLSTYGDPRSNVDAGQRLDISTAIHSEVGIIARAAKQGLSLDGTSAYVTTFPCPNCARLLAEAGIKKVYYQKGYSLLDAEDILKAYGGEIGRVRG